MCAARQAGREIERFHFDNAFEGRDLPNRVNRSGRKRGVHCHLGRKFLKDCRSDQIIAARNAVGYNFRLVLSRPRHRLGNIIAAG